MSLISGLIPTVLVGCHRDLMAIIIARLRFENLSIPQDAVRALQIKGKGLSLER